MRFALFIILCFIFYFLSFVMYKKYHIKKLAINYLLCLLGTSAMYALSVLLLRSNTEALGYCFSFFNSALLIIVFNLIILVARVAIKFIGKLLLGFHMKHNPFLTDDRKVQMIDRYISVFTGLFRFFQLASCIIFIIMLMFG